MQNSPSWLRRRGAGAPRRVSHDAREKMRPTALNRTPTLLGAVRPMLRCANEVEQPEHLHTSQPSCGEAAARIGRLEQPATCNESESGAVQRLLPLRVGVGIGNRGATAVHGRRAIVSLALPIRVGARLAQGAHHVRVAQSGCIVERGIVR